MLVCCLRCKGSLSKSCHRYAGAAYIKVVSDDKCSHFQHLARGRTASHGATTDANTFRFRTSGHHVLSDGRRAHECSCLVTLRPGTAFLFALTSAARCGQQQQTSPVPSLYYLLFLIPRYQHADHGSLACRPHDLALAASGVPSSPHLSPGCGHAATSFPWEPPCRPGWALARSGAGSDFHYGVQLTPGCRQPSGQPSPRFAAQRS